jgi:hypothetical protein
VTRTPLRSEEHSNIFDPHCGSSSSSEHSTEWRLCARCKVLGIGKLDIEATYGPLATIQTLNLKSDCSLYQQFQKIFDTFRGPDAQLQNKREFFLSQERFAVRAGVDDEYSSVRCLVLHLGFPPRRIRLLPTLESLND